jgi:hypothetical protein
MSEVKHTNRQYQVGGRNGYYGIDEYTEKGCIRMIDSFKTRKQAESTANDLNSAYYEGFRDAHIGLTIPLYRTCTGTHYEKGVAMAEYVVKAGTLVKVLRKDSAAFFTVEDVATGFQFDCQFCELRDMAGTKWAA